MRLPVPLLSTPAGKKVATPLERHGMAAAAVVALHLVLYVLSAAVQAIADTRLHIVTVVSIVSAYCSLGAIWWARSHLPAHWKTFVAILVCADLWMLLVSNLEVVRKEPVAAAGWGVALSLQVALTALAAVQIESRSPQADTAPRRTFSILYLLIWTTVVAVILGMARHIAVRTGWTLAAVFQWHFTRQVLCYALVNAALAACLLASVRLSRTWITCATTCVAILLAFSLVAPALLFALFWPAARVGAGFASLVWLWTFQGLFLLSALIPWELAGNRHKLASLAETP